MNTAATEYDGVNKYIRITDIDENTSQYSPNDIVSPLGILEDKYLVKANDILFARTGASTGKTYHYQESDGKLYFAGFLIRAKISYRYNSKFIFYQTQTYQYKKWIGIMSARSGQPGINSQEYGILPIAITSNEEQDKIARFLSLIDERIVTQNKIIAHLESLIKGLYSTTSKIGWRNYLLSELMIERKELNTSLFPVYSVSVDVGLVDQIEHLGRSFAAKDTSNYNVVRLGDVVYTKSPTGSFPFGIVKQSLVNVAVAVSPLYGVYQPKSIHIGRIIQHYFASPIRTSNYLHSLIQKGAKNTINISTQHFLDKAILLPSREDEIICLSKLLDSYNSKCELEKALREHLLSQKTYLLQKMFI